ncbi:hypothetical protein niasHT_010578 [Heterodera trifolii]|uniref:Uncharacterized protein n=1 Tax=Heterodera trifolii TaxID=157864 RepID=A0ABD2L4B9_9BILA
MSDNRKEAEEKMAKAIFISADCWLCVFDLLAPSQLGFGISMISHRFDYYVDEHFKTRKWTLKFIQIRRKIGENGTKEMEITNLDGEELPIAQIQLLRKLIGFKRIIIHYIDRNVIAFLDRLSPLFASFPINLAFGTNNDRILDLVICNTWPMLGKNFHGIESYPSFFHRLRHITPSMLNELCPPLRVFNACFGDLFPEFPAVDSAMASDRQAMAKWLFAPLQSNVPKLFKCEFVRNEQEDWPLKIEAFKAAFASASSPVNFIVSIWFLPPFAASVVPFDLTNELTREQLTLKRMNNSDHFLLVCSPIARDESKWTKWEEEAIDWKFFDQWNKIDIHIDNEDNIGDGLLDETPGPTKGDKNFCGERGRREPTLPRAKSAVCFPLFPFSADPSQGREGTDEPKNRRPAGVEDSCGEDRRSGGGGGQRRRREQQKGEGNRPTKSPEHNSQI